MSSSVWMIGFETAVDTEALIAANSYCVQATTSWDAAVQSLGAAAARLSACWTFAFTPRSATLLIDASEAVQSAVSACTAASAVTTALATWRERAAQLYSHAEDNAVSLSHSCQSASFAHCASPFAAFKLFGTAPLRKAEGLFTARSLNRLPFGNSGETARALAFLLNPPGAPWYKQESVVVSGYSSVVIAGPQSAVAAAQRQLSSWPAAPPAPFTVSTPRTASEAVLALRDSPSNGQVRILEHTSPSGAKSWTVLINGTRTWGALGPNPQDMETNLQEVGGFDSAQQQAVITAMGMAGIKAGQPVELVCHSQGGTVGQGVAATAADRFNIVSVLTAGSPTRTGTAPHPNSLSLVNVADVVPGLGGSAHQGLTAYGENESSYGAHSLESYAEIARLAEDTPDGNQWATARSIHMNLTSLTTTQLHTFNTERIRTSPTR